MLLCLIGAMPCFAELVPIEGSTNRMDNGSSEGESSICADIEFMFARGSGAELNQSEMWLKFKSEMG